MDNSEYNPDEVIITSSSNMVAVYESNLNNIIKAYKVNKIAPKCLSMLADEYLIGASMNMPDIKTWAISEQTITSNPCGTANALAVTSCGTYCVAAFKSEMTIWNVRSGEMVIKFTRHYQDVTCLKFTCDDSLLISGGKDGQVLVWLFCSLVAVQNEGLVKPLYNWLNHSKDITDIYVGDLGNCSRVATCSRDQTVKIYELESGLLLTTIYMDLPLTALTMDSMEYYMIVGTSKGTIFKINLYYEQPKELHSNTMEKQEIVAHNDEVTCLSMSIVGEKFLSISTDGLLKVWEVDSMSCIASTMNKDGPYTNAFFTLKPSLLLSHQKPSFVLTQLQRAISPNWRNNTYSTPLRLSGSQQPLTLINAGSVDGVLPETILTAVPEREHTGPIDVLQVNESLYQEAFRGETLNEVRDINAQMYTFMIEHAFSSMGKVPLKSDEVADDTQ